MPTYVSRLSAVTARAVVLARTALAAPPVSGRVYTQAPSDLALPCVTVIASESSMAETETGSGSRVELVGTAYSLQAGTLEVDQIAAALASAWTDPSAWLTIDGGGIGVFVGHDRPYVADWDGRLVTVRETIVAVWFP